MKSNKCQHPLARISIFRLNWRMLLVMGSAMILLTGCAASRAYRDGNNLLSEGKYDQALSKLEESVRLDPSNAEYRIALANVRSSIVNHYISLAEAHRRSGRLSEAEKTYRQVQVVDVDNAMAKQGLDMVALERRHRQVIAEADALFKTGSTVNVQLASEKVREVLSENPRQKDGLYLKAKMDEQRSKSAKVDAKLASSFQKKISLEFRDAPLKSVLEVVSKISGLNFFYDKDIRPDLKATIFAKDTTIEDALRLILVTNQLEQKILNDNSVLIYPHTQEKLKEYQTLAVRSFYITNADVKSVSNSIKTIVKTKDIVVDERLGIIIIRDTPEAIRMAERLIALQDLSEPEVMLEVEILEIKRSRLLQLGVQWPSQVTLSPLQIDDAPLTIDDIKGLNSSNIQAGVGSLSINLRKEDQDGNILANPRIRVRNKEKAKIQIGDRVPVITTTSTSTGFVSESVNYVDVGLKLEVEPNIYLDEEVAIKVNLEVSNLVREILSKSGSLSYQIGTRGANTVLRLRDGETQILAGLISDEERSTSNKFPGLGELPIAGRLFGSQKDDSQRSEILLSITPRIVRTIKRPDMLDAEFESGTENAIGSRSLSLGETEAAQNESEKESDNDSPATDKSPATAVEELQGNKSQLNTIEPNETSMPVSKSTTSAPITLLWAGPAQVKVGEQFNVVLKINTEQAISGLPLMLEFDALALQFATMQEGNFLKQGNAQTSFSQRIDPIKGKIFVALVRQNTTGSEAGVNGSGDIVTLSFKALKAMGKTEVRVLSATPESKSDISIQKLSSHSLRIVP